MSALKARGDAAMDAHHYDDAISAYTRAYETSSDPVFLYNRGRAHEARGEYVLAFDDLDRFKKTAAPDLRARVPKLDQLLADVSSRVSTLELTCSVEGARVLVAGREIGTTPLPATRLAAAHAILEIVAEGHAPYKKEIDLRGGATTIIDATLTARAVLRPLPEIEQRPATATKRSGVLASPIFWTVVGVVVIGGVTAGVLAATIERGADVGTFSPGQVHGP